MTGSIGLASWRRGCLYILCLAAAVACAGRVDEMENRLEAQAGKVAEAEKSLAKEQKRLKTMVDSLEHRVARNVEIGMQEAQARSIEQTLLKAQKAVVSAEEINLTTQREYLALLEKQVAALKGQ